MDDAEIEIRRQLQDLLRRRGVFVFKTDFEFGVRGLSGFKPLLPYDLAGIASSPAGDVGLFLVRSAGPLPNLPRRPLVMVDREATIKALDTVELSELFGVVMRLPEVDSYVRAEIEALDLTFFDGWVNLWVNVEIEDYTLHVGAFSPQLEIEA